MPGETIKLPHHFEPRSYQLPLLKAMDVGGYKRAVAVWHRRSGKDKTVINFMAKRMYERVGAYYYLFPTFKQARKVIWDGRDRDGFKFTDHIPKALRKRTDNQEMQIETNNGSIFQLIGTDDIDRITGTNPFGLVFSEWSLQNPAAWDIMRPILAENEGWAIFIYTPRGKNHGWKTLETARTFPEEWYSEVLTAKDTGAISESVLRQERREIVFKYGNDSLYQQEYMCDFNIPIQGAYFADQLVAADDDGRIAGVPHDPAREVHTFWDLGIDDSTTIWFGQFVGQEIHLIDYYENREKGIPHYVKMLKDKKDYLYGRHFAPHDIEQRELTSGRTRRETAEGLGIKFEVVPRVAHKEDAIEAVRNVIPRCWFDAVKCERGLDALKSYCKEWDEEKQVFKTTPVHNWASHSADSFMTLATGWFEKISTDQIVHNEVNPDPFY